MNAEEIIALIERRRDEFFDAQIAGNSSDPIIYSGADLQRAIADEYDTLLAQIRNKT